MKKLITLFVKYPFYANIIIAVLIIGGVTGFMGMKKSFFPERTPRFITVSVVYLGASPKEMEEGITTRIEQSVRGIVGIKEITSTSSENYSNVRIETTGEYDIDETLMEVKNAVDGITSFPSAAEKPVISKQRSMTRAGFLGLSGNVDILTLKKYADLIEEDLRNSKPISQLTIQGYPPLEISIEVSEEDLLRYNLTFQDLINAVSMNNRDVSAGQIKSLEEEILIRSRRRSVDPNKIGNIILQAKDDGSYLRVRDVAEVKMKFQDVASGMTMNGKPAVTFDIMKLPEEDLSEISEWLDNYVAEFNERHDEVVLEVTFDFMTLLNARLSLLTKNGIIGLLLVVASLTFFLSFRLSLWVAWGIPASFLAMFIVASLHGITINMISLFGMILVIGILVDDGIVIGENIYSHFELGKRPPRAAIDGTMEVYPAVLTSITTTIIAFAPLLFIKQSRMEFMYEMAFVVIFSLAFSLVEAFFVLPAHLASRHVLRTNHNNTFGRRLRKRIDSWIFFVRDKIYGRFLRMIVNWKWITIAIPVGLIIITVGLFRGELIQATFFPSIPFDTFTINIAFKPGTGEKKTQEYISRFEDIVWEVNDSLQQRPDDTAAYISHSYAVLGRAFNGQESGSHAGQVQVFFNDMEGRQLSSFKISDIVQDRIGPMPEAEKFSVGGGSRWGYPVAVSLLSNNLDQLEHAKFFLMDEMRKIPDIKDIVDNNAIGKQEVRLKLKPKAYFLGLDQVSLSNQVRQGFYGGQAQRLQHGKDELRIWVRYPKEDRLNLGKLEAMKIKTPRGEYPLMELADYDIERGPVNIQRYNGSREVRINADLVDPYQPVPPILERIKTDIMPELKEKFPAIRVEYQGQQKTSRETGQEVLQYFMIAFAIIVLLLMIHFKSFLQASIVLLMIPLAWIGAAWGHGLETFFSTAIRGQPAIPVSMLSVWGMVALSGVIINDAVVFLSKYNSLLVQGESVPEAVFNAGKARFRPILLTTITTTVGLYPIILEQSFQAQFLKPMAIALAYGVLIGTGFILIFFPALILVMNDVKRALKWIWTGIRPKQEDVETALIDSQKVID